jgi:hypothetical protein
VLLRPQIVFRVECGIKEEDKIVGLLKITILIPMEKN